MNVPVASWVKGQVRVDQPTPTFNGEGDALEYGRVGFVETCDAAVTIPISAQKFDHVVTFVGGNGVTSAVTDPSARAVLGSPNVSPNTRSNCYTGSAFSFFIECVCFFVGHVLEEMGAVGQTTNRDFTCNASAILGWPLVLARDVTLISAHLCKCSAS